MAEFFMNPKIEMYEKLPRSLILVLLFITTIFLKTCTVRCVFVFYNTSVKIICTKISESRLTRNYTDTGDIRGFKQGTQPFLTCSSSTVGKLGKGVKYETLFWCFYC